MAVDGGDGGVVGGGGKIGGGGTVLRRNLGNPFFCGLWIFYFKIFFFWVFFFGFWFLVFGSGINGDRRRIKSKEGENESMMN